MSRNDHCINVYAAIVPNLHDEMILTADAVDRLFMMPESDVKLARILTRSMATAQNDDDDDKDGDAKHVIAESDSNFLSSGNTINGDVDVDDGDIGVRECTDDANVQCDDVSVASRDELIKEQKDDISLRGAWKLAESGRAGFLIREGLLYHRASILGQSYSQLVVPSTRSTHVLKMGHEVIKL